MPHFLGKDLVVTKEELIPNFWNTYNALKMELYRYKDRDYGVKRKMLGGNGRKLLVLFDSLPADIQNALGDPRVLDHILEKHFRFLPEVREFYQNFTYPTDGRYLKPKSIEKYIINANVLQALILLEDARITEITLLSGSTKGILKTLYNDAINFNQVLIKKHNTQHHLNSSYRRFKQQYNAFKEHGYISLIKDAQGKAKQNARVITKEYKELLDNLFAGVDYKPNPTEVARVYDTFLNGYTEIKNKVTGEIYNPKHFKQLSKSAITTYLRSYESKAGTYNKRSGDRQKLLQDFVPYESLAPINFAGTIISIDDRQPPFFYEKGKRMWWYIGFDLGSEAITCWAYGKTKTELIKNFYINMIANYHNWGVELPHELECESSLNSSFKNTFLQDGAMFQRVQIHANSARSKRVERFFRDIRYELEKPETGWLARPFARSEANQKSNEKEVIVPYDKLVTLCFKTIEKWNNMPKKGSNISRFDYFLQNQNPDLKATNYKGILPHLGRSTLSSCKAGMVKLQRNEWLLGDDNQIYTGEKLIQLLKRVEGKDIELRWLNNEEDTVIKALVYDTKEGRYICEILPKPITARAELEETPEQRENRTIIARYRTTVTAYMQQKKNAIDSVIVTHEKPVTVSNSFSINRSDSEEIEFELPEELKEIYENPIEPYQSDLLESPLDRAFN